MTVEEAIRDLHRRFEEDVLPWDCVEGNCEHTEAHECPTVREAFCAEEVSVAHDCGYEEGYPAKAAWPCDTIRVLEAVAPVPPDSGEGE